MENRSALGFAILFIPLLLYPCEVFAYEQKTHMGITQATIETYGKVFGNQLSQNDTSAVVRGSSDEDLNLRPVNHFFDPVHERGLTIGLISWQESKVWAQDTVAQANFCIERFCNSRIGYADKYFSSPTDYSWDREIYEYVYGSKQRGLEGLGHILHLLQDASVPAHVRNDQHLNHDGYGDPDPYEQFTSKFTVGNVPSLSLPVSVPQRSSLSAYIDAVAGFTNGHFLSKDTLFIDFDYPNLDQVDLRNDGFAYDPVLKHKVAEVRASSENFGLSSKKIITLKDPDDLVLKDYWSLLSKEAIRNGVGVIDLFFKAVEEEKRTHTLQKKNVSQQEVDAKNLVLKGFSIAKKLYGSSLDESDVSDLMGSQPAAVAGAFDDATSPAANSDQSNQESQQPQTVVPTSKVEAEPADSNPPQKPTTESNPTPTKTSTKATTVPVSGQVVPLNNPSMSGVGGGDSGRASSAAASTPEPTPTPAPVVVVPAPVFTAPNPDERFGTTNIALSGTADPNASVTLTITAPGGATTSASTTASIIGIWGVTLTASEGITSISAVASDGSGNNSSAATRSFSVDITAPSVSTFSLLECEHSLATDTCATAGSAHPKISTVSSDVLQYSYIVDGTVTATTTALGSVSLTTGSHSVAVAAYDYAGNGATSTAVTIESLAMPLVINEVAWAGTAASASDQWVELYNRSTHQLDLSQVSISTSDSLNSFALSGTLSAGAYYLIEKNETTTSVASDLLAPTLTFSSTPTQGTLSYNPGGSATMTLDQTPAESACGGSWCAGTSDTDKRSMERTAVGTNGTTVSNWNSNNKLIKNGTDSALGALNATPKARNSNTFDSINYTRNTNLNDFFVEDGYYQPTSGTCHYYMPSLASGNHFGVVFAGTVGNAITYDGHFLGASTDSIQHSDLVPVLYQVQGQDLFAVMYKTTPGPGSSDENTAFLNFFLTGANPPPSNNFGILRFKWGVAP